MLETMRVRGWLLPVLVLSLGVATAIGCGGSGPGGTAGGAGAPGGAEAEPVPLVPLEELNRVVAEVNGTPIRARKLNEVTEINKMQIESRGITLTDDDEAQMRRRALQLIIDAELMYQAAKAANMNVDSRQVDQRLQEARSKFESEKDYEDYLRNAQLTEDEVRQEARQQLLVQQYMQSITGDMPVDEEIVRRLYDENKKDFMEGEQVRAAYILVKCSPDDPQAKRDDARRRIDQAYAAIQEGQDFAAVAREFSQAPNAAKGGDVGFFPRGVMVPQFEEIAFKTAVGEVTPVFETAFGFNVLKVLDRKEPKPVPFEEVKPTLMLLVAQRQESMAVQQRLNELREAATISILDEKLKPQAAKAEGGTGQG